MVAIENKTQWESLGGQGRRSEQKGIYIEKIYIDFKSQMHLSLKAVRNLGIRDELLIIITKL